LKYVHGRVVGYPPGATFGPRDLNDYELVWIIEGQVLYRADGRDYPAPPGSIVLCRPGFRDAFVWDREHDTRHGFFHFDIGGPFPEDFPQPADWPVCVTLQDNDVVRPLFRSVLAQISGVRQTTVVTPMLRRAVELLLGSLLIGPQGQLLEHRADLPEPVRRALDHIRRALDGDPAAALDLPALAQAAVVSPEHLCRLFRNTVKMGPMEAVRLHRLDAAVGLMARSNLNIAQIAYRCGFASPYHFSRRFHDAYGQSPREVRRSIDEGKMPPMNPMIVRLRQVGR
jgi:AraC-like DNA-binding protein